MRMPQNQQEEANFAMAPMIDMVFLLLVFFMCASHLSSSRSLPLDIPTASKGVVPKERPDRWTVNITVDGTIYSGTTQINVDDLKQQVTARLEEQPKLKVYLRADAATEHREVKRVMKAMADAGIGDFIFGVYQPTASQGATP